MKSQLLCAGLVLALAARAGADVSSDARRQTTQEIIAAARQTYSLSSRVEAKEYRVKAVVALAQLGDLADALKLVPRPRDQWDEVPLHASNEIWRVTARQRALQGDIMGAQFAAYVIMDEASRADALLSIARSQLRDNDNAAALKSLYAASPLVRHSQGTTSTALEHHETCPEALAYVAWLFARAGDRRAAIRLFDAAEQTPPPFFFWMKQTDARAESRGAIGYYAAKAGFWTRAIKLTGTDYEQFHDIIRLAEARGNWSEAVTLAVMSPRASLRASYFAEFARSRLKKGRRAEGEKFLNRALAEVPSALAESTAVHSQNSKSSERPSFINVMRVVGTLALFGRIDDAEQLQARIEGLLPAKSKRLIALTHAQLELLSIISAVWSPASLAPQQDAIGEVLGKASAVQDPRARFYELGTIRRVQLHRGEREGAYHTLQKMIAAAQEEMVAAQDVNNTALALYAARLLRENGSDEQAQLLVHRVVGLSIPNEKPQDEAFWLASNGFFDTAWQILREHPYQRGTGNNLGEMAQWQATTRLQEKQPLGAPPTWIMSLHDPRNRLDALTVWADVLTQPTDRKAAAEEKELVLSPDGCRSDPYDEDWSNEDFS